MENEFQFKMGRIVRDTISGFEGVVTARCQYLGDANGYRITPNAQGGEIKDEWVSESRLVYVNE